MELPPADALNAPPRNADTPIASSDLPSAADDLLINVDVRAALR